jgi:hypothetical protein
MDCGDISNSFGDIKATFALAGANTILRTTLNTIEIGGVVLKTVLTMAVFRLHFRVFTYEKRRGRESNPRIAVLQTATLPLGYPAELRERTISLSWRLYQAPSIDT